MVKVAVLGYTGMLGRMVLDVVDGAEPYAIRISTDDDNHIFKHDWNDYTGLSRYDFVVNCIGLVKPLCTNVQHAVRVNTEFPQRLAAMTSGPDMPHVIHITTDCVFSGHAGPYEETREHDALDVYGKTKSLGEVDAPHVLNLRTSIIGPESPGRKRGLLEWVRNYEDGSTLAGYENHLWNGCTTLQLARFINLIVTMETPNEGSSGTCHVVLNHDTTKARVVESVVTAYRLPLEVERTNVQKAKDMRLRSIVPSTWKLGHIEDALAELAEHSLSKTNPCPT